MSRSEPQSDQFASIKVVGVGGGGCNAVNRMIESGIRGVEFIAVNTDAQALELSKASMRLQIGKKILHGIGANGDAEMGHKAAEESAEELQEVLQDADMIFLTAGLGGGTGTGATPVIARIAKEAGALVIAVVTHPFTFEGNKRVQRSEVAIAELRKHVDTLIVIPSDRLLQIMDKRSSLSDAFHVADDFLRQGVQGISELVTVPGLINLDFEDVKTIMSAGGATLFTIGMASGRDRARVAAEQALSSLLLDVTIDGARGVLFNVTGGPGLSLIEVNQVAALIKESAHPDANMLFGAVIDPDMGDTLRVTIIATGFDDPHILIRTSTRESSQNSGLHRQDAESSQPLVNTVDLDLPAFVRHRSYLAGDSTTDAPPPEKGDKDGHPKRRKK